MKTGHQTWSFARAPRIISTGTIVGPDEGAGPLGNCFDRVHGDLRLNKDSWEKAERALLEEAAKVAIGKAGLVEANVDMWIAGDLLNQIISSSFTARTLGIPYLGVFGACSTAMQSLAVGSLLIESGAAERVLTAACSHRATAERQFRNPTEYGVQKPPSAQFTVTGAGAALISDPDLPAKKNGAMTSVQSACYENAVRITGATIGRVVDLGVDDPYNMGAAMAPAAVDTIQAHFRDTGRGPADYDAIITGDLATVGHQMALALFEQHGVPIRDTLFTDCGLLIFDLLKQQVWSGGSGCGCAAVVTYGHWLKKLREKQLNRILVVATGALLSPVSSQQDETIPCIAHAVVLESQ